MAVAYVTPESRWTALSNRDPAAEGYFIYCVTSTHICCRPTCSARLPLRKNVSFCSNVLEAIEQGFIPCKRCKPDQVKGWNTTREVVAKACANIAQAARAKTPMDVDAIALSLGVSKWHFCRSFKTYTEFTPRLFYIKCLQGVNPLLTRPLPAVETKKNVARKRNQSGFQGLLQSTTSTGTSLFEHEIPTPLSSLFNLIGQSGPEDGDYALDFLLTDFGDDFMPWYELLLVQDT